VVAILAIVLETGALAGILLFPLMIFLFNRPKTFVPPHMRAQPGYLAESRRLGQRRNG
jgi:hypothetical protein